MSKIPDDSRDRYPSPFYPSLLSKHEHLKPLALEGELVPTIVTTPDGGIGVPVVPRVFDRQDPTKSTTWWLDQDTPTVPLAFDHWIEYPIPIISRLESDRLAQIVGKSDVGMENWLRLQNVIQDLISEIAFPELQSHWSELADHLDEIIRTGTEYLNVAWPSLNLDDAAVIVPAPITIFVSLMSCPNTARNMRTSFFGVERTVKHCQKLRELMKPKIRPGEKGLPTVRDLLAIVVNIAGDKLALPSNQNMDSKTTPLLTLARETLSIACRVGTKALEQATISDDRRAKAIGMLGEIGGKTNRALADQLRPIKRAKKKGG